MNTEQQAVDFVTRFVKEMGLALEVRVESTADGMRINLDGPGGDALLARRAEGLQALQHLVDTAFRRQLGDRRLMIDCLGYRRDKDNELRQMARYLADRAKSTGVEQNIGPLNSYERRIVHLAVAEDPDVASESIGDAAVKTVVISKKPARR
jgi:spoIIIJ-associated protein